MNPYIFYENYKIYGNDGTYDYCDLIFLNKNEIIKMKKENIIFGHLYLKVSKNNFFKKWSNRYFFLKDNILHIWKKKKNKNIKCEKIYLNSHFGISGIQYNNKHKYITFYIYYFKSNRSMKKFYFKSYNLKDIFCFYNSIEQIIYKKKN